MKSVILILAVLIVSSCSSSSYFKEPTPELKLAVIGVTNQYLGAITTNHLDQINGMVLWTDYAKSRSLDKLDIERQITRLNEGFRPTDPEHPLTQLEVTDIEVDGNNATVSLRKIGGEEEFDVDLRWIGEGWMVVSDSLFGSSGYLNEF